MLRISTRKAKRYRGGEGMKARALLNRLDKGLPMNQTTTQLDGIARSLELYAKALQRGRLTFTSEEKAHVRGVITEIRIFSDEILHELGCDL